MKNLIPFIVLTFISFYSYSQDNNISIAKPKGSIKTEVKASAVVPQVVVKSDYNNWETQILEHLTIDYIPNNLPTYKATMTDDEYEAILKTWASENPTFIKK